MGLKPVSVIKANLGIEPNGRIHKYFAERCRDYMNEKYVPVRDENLINTSYVDSQCNIVYQQKYAHAQYVGVVNGGEVKNYTKPGTGPYWDKRMVSADMPQIVKEVQSKVNGG